MAAEAVYQEFTQAHGPGNPALMVDRHQSTEEIGRALLFTLAGAKETPKCLWIRCLVGLLVVPIALQPRCSRASLRLPDTPVTHVGECQPRRP